jgi:hypothetical protein
MNENLRSWNDGPTKRAILDFVELLDYLEADGFSNSIDSGGV